MAILISHEINLGQKAFAGINRNTRGKSRENPLRKHSLCIFTWA